MTRPSHDTRQLRDDILALKERKNAVILAHNYQLGEIQDIADLTGDSLELSRKAAATDADIIVFCGVHFMAETAKILSPDKMVLLPDLRAGCPMADMINADELREEKRLRPAATVICYVNSSAEVKAESDICCTSANSVAVINSLPADVESVYFVPDQYLAQYTARFTSRKIEYWPGYCPTHARLDPRDIDKRRREFPGCVVIVHPECPPEIIDAADHVFSTGGMIRHVAGTSGKVFIIGTELGIIHRLKRESPDNLYIPLSEQAVCPNMKFTRLTKLRDSLEKEIHQIHIPENIIRRARRSVERMIQTG